MSSDEEDVLDGIRNIIFEEPSDYYPPPKPATFESKTLQTGEALQLRLVGYNPLWGHHLWNGAQVVTDYLYDHARDLVHGRTVLELGAGAGLPSIAAAIWGAKQVVVTDYPDEDLVENLQINIDAAKDVLPRSANIVAKGHAWGASTEPLLSCLRPGWCGFDTLVLADLLFNHGQHAALVSTIQSTLVHLPHARALVFFTPYTPWKFDKDMAFFDLARKGGFQVVKVVEKVMDKVMFKDDRGDELLRRTVFGYELSYEHTALE
ncbi:MAG: hypothetical protein L6R38_000607 [Xanthoria sp. 2 TBL-2021]|nr:MAG: hypothetical protein L6R38_000607 [Xanthoria sp. 2 TBL-2021]